MSRRTSSRVPLGVAGLSAELVFAGWAALTVVHQFKRGRRISGVLDPLGFWLPIWTFFGPIPGTIDSEIVYRYVYEEGATTDWAHLPIYESRERLHLLVHFNRRREKVVFDAVSEVLRLLREDAGDEYVITSTSYIVLLSFLQSETRPPTGASYVQFMIVNSTSADERISGTVPIFVSAKHRITAPVQTEVQ